MCRCTGRSNRSRSARDQGPGGRRPEQPGHVLDRQHVRAGVDDLLGQAQVVVQRVELLGRVGQVAGVAERDLGDRGAGRPDGVDRRAHLLDVVERVEDPEDVDPGARGLGDEGVGDGLRVRRVADRVAAAQQHLQAMFGIASRSVGQPFPGVLGQEAQRDVVGRAAPGLDRQQLGGQPGDGRADRSTRSRVRTRVASSDWWASRKVVSVTLRSVLSAQPVARSPPGPSSASRCRDTGRRRPAQVDGRAACRRVDQVGRALPVRAVDGDVGQVGQQPGATVGGVPGGQQLRMRLDEAGGDPAGGEVRVVQHRLQERDVGGHTADPELGQRPAGPGDGLRPVPAAAGQLDQQRVEVGADLGAGMHRAAVHPGTGAAGRAVGDDLAGVRPEAVGRVLGGDPALQGGPPDLDLVLPQPEIVQGLAGGDPDLRGDQVDVGDLLGDGVLDLDPRVHLDEEVPTRFVDQELDGAGVDVADVPGEGHGVGADPVAQLRIETDRRRDLDDLLVPALHRAVPLEEVDGAVQVAVGGAMVGQDLHLDVAGFDHRLSRKTVGSPNADSASRIAVASASRQRVGSIDPAHAAATAAGDGLDEQRVADRRRPRR